MRSAFFLCLCVWLFCCAEKLYANSLQEIARGCVGLEGKIEKMVCADEYLSSLEKYLAQLSAGYRRIGFSPASFDHQWDDWRMKRSRCGDARCLRWMYIDRINQVVSDWRLIDPALKALDIGLVESFFYSSVKKHPHLDINRMLASGFGAPGGLFAHALFRLKVADLVGFERIDVDSYKFKYFYIIDHPKLENIVVYGSFSVDSAGVMTAVSDRTNISAIEAQGEILRALVPSEFNDHVVVKDVIKSLGEKEGSIPFGGKIEDFLVALEHLAVSRFAAKGCAAGPGAVGVVKGSVFNDILACNWGGKVISGGFGNDVIDGGFDEDVIIGGAGDDIINSGYGDVIVYAGKGGDRVKLGGRGATLLFGNDWGRDIYEVDGDAYGERASCERFTVLLVFSAAIQKNQLIWDGANVITDKVTGSTITFGQKMPKCMNIVYSEVNF